MLWVQSLGSAQEEAGQTQVSSGADSSPPPEGLTIEFLEFLADWETADGRWLDPAELEPVALPSDEPVQGERR